MDKAKYYAGLFCWIAIAFILTVARVVTVLTGVIAIEIIITIALYISWWCVGSVIARLVWWNDFQYDENDYEINLIEDDE